MSTPTPMSLGQQLHDEHMQLFGRCPDTGECPFCALHQLEMQCEIERRASRNPCDICNRERDSIGRCKICEQNGEFLEFNELGECAEMPV